jgi:hypothetical protein
MDLIAPPSMAGYQRIRSVGILISRDKYKQPRADGLEEKVLGCRILCYAFIIMVPKLLVASAALFILSGCCRLFGICSSIHVHTSISSPRQFTQQEMQGTTVATNMPGFAVEPTVPQTASAGSL